MSNSKITTPACDSVSMSYYLNARETIHGLDNLIASAIHQGVTMITAALTLAVLLYEKLGSPSHSVAPALLLTIIAFFITLNANRRVSLYTRLLGETVEAAKNLEEKLISDKEVRITHRIEEQVKYAGLTGRRIYLRSIIVFYWIEAVLVLYFLIDAIFGLHK